MVPAGMPASLHSWAKRSAFRGVCGVRAGWEIGAVCVSVCVFGGEASWHSPQPHAAASTQIPRAASGRSLSNPSALRASALHSCHQGHTHPHKQPTQPPTCSAGFSTTQLPAARAGATFQASMSRGKFCRQYGKTEGAGDGRVGRWGGASVTVGRRGEGGVQGSAVVAPPPTTYSVDEQPPINREQTALAPTQGMIWPTTPMGSCRV